MADGLFFTDFNELKDTGLLHRGDRESKNSRDRCLGINLHVLSDGYFYITDGGPALFSYSHEFVTEVANSSLRVPFLQYPILPLYEDFVANYNSYTEEVDEDTHNALLKEDVIKIAYEDSDPNIPLSIIDEFEVPYAQFVKGPKILVWLFGGNVYLKWDPESYHGDSSRWRAGHTVIELSRPDYEKSLEIFGQNIIDNLEPKITKLEAVCGDFSKLGKELRSIEKVKKYSKV